MMSDPNVIDIDQTKVPSSMESQVKSKKRVMDHGEVLTGEREVNAMLDLVQQEIERIDSRFLDPACGDGNFLAPILERKLAIVLKRYGASQLEYDRYSIMALSSIYGIDILQDNVEHCRKRLLTIFMLHYETRFKNQRHSKYYDSAQFILARNILWGDALTLMTVDEQPQNILFSEWTLISGSMMKRRDFTYHALITQREMSELPLFSDLGEDVFIPTPERDYPPIHFLEIANVQRQHT